MPDDDRVLEHERTLLACALQDAGAARELLAIVQAPMLADPRLSRAWSALRRTLADEHGPVDLVTAVNDELAGDGGAGGDGPGLVELHEIHDLVPSAANATWYAGRVLDAYVRREAAGMLAETETERTREMETSDLLVGVEQRFRRLRELHAGPHRHLPEPLVGSSWDAEPPAREWLVDGWLSRGELALLTGPGSVGKGILALQIGAALACDRNPLQNANGWLPSGSAVSATAPELCAEPLPVVLAGWEDDRHEIMRRRHRLTMYGGCGWAGHPSINDRLHVLPMRGHGPLWAPDPGSRHVSTVGGMTPAGDDLLHYAEKVDAELLVVDPAGLAICTNENDRALVSIVLDALAGWAMRTGCTVLLVGHPAKVPTGEAADYSGNTAWRGTVRALWTLRQPSEGQADRNSDEWRRLVGHDPDRLERVAYLTRNKNNYGWDGDALTVATCGGRAGWYLTDRLSAPASARKNRKETATANGAGGKVPGV